MIKLNIKLRVLNLIARHKTRNPFKLVRLLNIEIVYEDFEECRTACPSSCAQTNF